MSSDSLSLTHMARNKMHTSSGSKDNYSLHRWVLLKNSLSTSPSASINAAPTTLSQINSTDHFDHRDDVIESSPEDGNSFLFPDAGNFVSTSQSRGSEAQWLDTLLKALVDDEDEDDFSDPYLISSATPAEEDDDDDGSLSPLNSPMASSDDLHNPVSFYAPDLAAVPYHFPYPQYQPSLRSYQDVSSSLSSRPAPYEDHLPYHDLDFVPDYPMPDTILEDTSDDESDTPSTPSFGRSSASLTLSESRPAHSMARSTLRHAKNQLYPNEGGIFLFEADPLPFSYRNSYNTYQEY